MRRAPWVPGTSLLPHAGRQTRRPQWQEPNPGGGAQNPAALLSHPARARRCRPGVARHPAAGGGRLTMRCAPALPKQQLMPAASSSSSPVATPVLGGLPGKTERPHPFTSPHVGHPIDHHVAGPPSVDPDKFFGLLRGRRACGKIGCGRSPRSTQLGAASPKISLIRGTDGGAAHCCYEHEGPTLFHPCSVPAGGRLVVIGCAGRISMMEEVEDAEL